MEAETQSLFMSTKLFTSTTQTLHHMYLSSSKV